MRSARTLAPTLLLAATLLCAGGWLLRQHARAWDLGGRSPVLSYDAAQYALAARELSEHGRLATTFALPIELASHPEPPWPLAAVQPGLVLSEALVDRIVPRSIPLGASRAITLAKPGEREWLSLALPIACYLAEALLLALAAVVLLRLASPALGSGPRLAAGVVAALMFMLDPEAQHFATGGFTELPYTLGTTCALLLVATGFAARRPLLFGLLLGVTGSFRANMLWLVPGFAIGAALLAERHARTRVAALVLAGYALPLAPWWVYKWRSFGSPGADLSRLMLWEGVEGRTWFTLLHLPEAPRLPSGMNAVSLLAGKVWSHLGALSLAIATGPRALWLGAVVIWLFTRPPRPLAIAGVIVLAQLGLGLLAAAATLPWLRYVFPARIPMEVAGMLASWALIARVPDQPLTPQTRRLIAAGVAVLALWWGAWQSALGLAEARATSSDRGIPSVATLTDLTSRLDAVLTRDEPVMSNLGPTLAYHARRPVLHLALSPEDVEACRVRLAFTNVLLAFRDGDRAWSEWKPVMEPGSEVHHPEWNVARARRWRTSDGFLVVWLELAVPRPQLARARL